MTEKARNYKRGLSTIREAMGSQSVAVLVTESGLDALPYTPGGRFDSVTFLNLTSRPLTESDIVDPVAPVETTVVNVDDRFHDHSDDTADRYVDFLERLPTAGDGPTLTTPIHRSIPFWWVAEDFCKSSVKHGDAVNVYCRGLVVKDLLASRDLDRAVVLTEDDAVSEFYHAMLSDTTDQLRPSRRWSLFLGLLMHFLLGLVRLGVELVKAVVGKLVGLMTPSPAVADRSVLLFTRAEHWSQTGWKEDRYYRRFPGVLSESTAERHRYLIRLSDDGLLTTIRQVVWRRKRGVPFVLLQSYSGVWTILSVLFSHCRATWQLTRFLLTIEDHCELDGLDLYPLLSDRLVPALSTLPHSLVEFECHRRVLAERTPSLCVTPYFEGKIGRTLVAAARPQEIPVIGIQHGPVAPGKIQYRIACADGTVRHDYALPDCIAVDGEYAADILRDGGFTETRIEPVGGPRYDHLFDEAPLGESRTDSSDSPVVVFFGRDDYRGMAAILLPLIEGLDDRVLVKPHPAVRAETLAYLQSRGVDAMPNVELVADDAHVLISQARVIVASYSSTAVESLALETPVISIRPRNRLDPSPFDETLVPTVISPQECRDALTTVETMPDGDIESFLDRFFGPRDGKAAHRLAELCAEMAEGSDPSSGTTRSSE